MLTLLLLKCTKAWSADTDWKTVKKDRVSEGGTSAWHRAFFLILGSSPALLPNCISRRRYVTSSKPGHTRDDHFPFQQLTNQWEPVGRLIPEVSKRKKVSKGEAVARPGLLPPSYGFLWRRFRSLSKPEQMLILLKYLP